MKTSVIEPFFLTQHTLAQPTEVHISCLESFPPLLVKGQLLAFNHDGGAAFQDPLRSAFHHQQVALVSGIVKLMDRQLIVGEIIEFMRVVHTQWAAF